ncbi:alpha/beta fold hydrolase [Gordonia sp. HS-NH1]|uniref:alpha/beta fold hydrolase n=1 Tax=Gordonia sp. HS-NH1 TaxID=1435068 RepID=UPI000AE8870E
MPGAFFVDAGGMIPHGAQGEIMTGSTADEFDHLAENRAEIGRDDFPLPVVERETVDVEGRALSALRWGRADPEVVFLHGGAQNAHTWDSVILELICRRPDLSAVAIDLPGHGHSDRRADRDYMPWTAAEAVLPVIGEVAPRARMLVGMSLGGLTAIRAVGLRPALVAHTVVVDVTPSVSTRLQGMSADQRGTTELASGPALFDDIESMTDSIAAMAPHRPRSAIRRGVIHNSKPVGTRYEWRYDRLSGADDFRPLWEHVETADTHFTLVRGGDSTFVDDADAREFAERAARFSEVVIAGAGHSVQSDRPVELAAVIDSALEG